MDTITASNAVSLNCDMELTNKMLGLHAKHYNQNYNKLKLLMRSCQDRIITVVNIAIDLISYLLNLFASFGWQSAHTIYCIQFIRLNQRALVHHIKSIGSDAVKNVQRKLYTFIEMLRRTESADNDNSNNNHMKCTYESKDTHEATNDSNTQIDDSNEIDNIELEILWQPNCGTQIRADVVFIHGLHGSSDSTWTQGQWVHEPTPTNDSRIENLSDSESNVHRHNIHSNDNLSSLNNATLDSLSQCWPKDWLPIDFPTARVCAINYDTDPFLWRPTWYPSLKRSSLATRAMKMIRILVDNKIGVNRPIIWVGHSKGGLYIKQIIVNSHECNAYWLWKSSNAVLFYSVPHRGSPLAELNVPLFTRSIEMIEIQKDFSTITDLHRRFVTMCRNGILKMDIFSFIEMKFTELSVFYFRIVGVDSGDPGIGGVRKVPLDHLDVCKPRSRSCFLYQKLANMINMAMKTHTRNVDMINAFDTNYFSQN